MTRKILGETSFHGVGKGLIDYFPGETRPNRIEELGGSACNAAGQAARFEIPSYLHAAIGDDRDGDRVISELTAIGVDTSGIYRKWAPTPRNTHVFDPNNPDTTKIIHNENHSADQHSLEDILASLRRVVIPGDIVYFAGLGRHKIIDHPEDSEDAYKFENLLDILKEELGAVLAIDPGRPPKLNDPRHHRASTFFKHALNTTKRTDILALNEDELFAYFGVSREILESESLSRPMFDRILHDEVMAKLVDRDTLRADASLLFCLTLGKHGIYLSNLEQSTFIGVPALAESDRRTKLGLGDSTKAGLFKALIYETQGIINADTISLLSAEQLQRIAAVGSAASTYRMKHEAYSNLDQMAELVEDRSEHFAPLDVTGDYIRLL